MYQRITVSAQKDFIPMLKQLQQNQEKAALLLEDGNIKRYEGFVDQINDKNQTVLFKDGTKISVLNLIAVNGIFTSGYSEC